MPDQEVARVINVAALCAKHSMMGLFYCRTPPSLSWCRSGFLLASLTAMRFSIADSNEFFERHGLFLPSGAYELGDNFSFSPPVSLNGGIANYSNFSIGPFTHSWSPLPACFSSIGNYCSIAGGCTFAIHDHPLTLLTTSSATYYTADFMWKFFEDKLGKHGRLNEVRSEQIIRHLVPLRMTTLEHDVWIGQNAFIKPGVTLHTGCVVAAYSVVTKSVPPYAVVAGNPARIKKFRFSAETIQLLLNSGWWKYSYVDLFENGIDFSDVHAALSLLSRLEKAGKIRHFQNPYFPL